MPESPINFFNEDVVFILKNKTLLRSWLTRCAFAEKKKIDALNFIFCSDPFLKKINNQYLNHNYFTDIITFPTADPGMKTISGDIYISIDRVKDNAAQYGVKFSEELHRVMAHGLLHLCGYGDKTEAEKIKMRKAEDGCLVQLLKISK